jgi:hypothetical protein
VVTFALIALTRAMFPTISHWILFIGLFITVSQAGGRILDSGRAFSPSSYSGATIPTYALYAVGFRELSRLLFKCTVVQLPFFVLYAVACSLMVASAANFQFWASVIFGFKIGCFAIAARFLSVTIGFSSGTNDTSNITLRKVAMVPLVVGAFILFLGLAVAALFLPDQRIAWLCWLLAVFDAYALFRIYGWFYHRNCFDLMKMPAT